MWLFDDCDHASAIPARVEERKGKERKGKEDCRLSTVDCPYIGNSVGLAFEHLPFTRIPSLHPSCISSPSPLLPFCPSTLHHHITYTHTHTHTSYTHTHISVVVLWSAKRYYAWPGQSLLLLLLIPSTTTIRAIVRTYLSPTATNHRYTREIRLVIGHFSRFPFPFSIFFCSILYWLWFLCCYLPLSNIIEVFFIKGQLHNTISLKGQPSIWPILSCTSGITTRLRGKRGKTKIKTRGNYPRQEKLQMMPPVRNCCEKELSRILLSHLF